MAKATIAVLVDDLDGSDGVETVRIGRNGDWRELDLSKRNLASLSKALDKYWTSAGRCRRMGGRVVVARRRRRGRARPGRGAIRS
jgi:Lsr2